MISTRTAVDSTFYGSILCTTSAENNAHDFNSSSCILDWSPLQTCSGLCTDTMRQIKADSKAL
ncbi:hypothetical protein M513_02185 [Trichuris suis]|nr:hypothetical protein M513_02185 [Trichuris suis]